MNRQEHNQGASQQGTKNGSQQQGMAAGAAGPNQGGPGNKWGQEQGPTLPGANLPKGGGAIHGIGEKFHANPVNGTASMTVPIATSPSRDGFNPALSLSYDSGSGNGPFGFGWSLSMDAITRKTSKGIPRYRDYEESDTFLLSGVEDLVPVLLDNGLRYEDTTTAPGYVIHRYQPRIEGEFQRIERWTSLQDATDVHWRVLTPSDSLTVYGRNKNSRIYDSEAPERVYTWLISDCRDWKGNGMSFTYKVENGQGVDVTLDHQQSRGLANDPHRQVNRYIKSIKYGNTKPFLDSNGQRFIFPSEALLNDAGYLFEVIFDYGEHDQHAPTPTETTEWLYRDDAFSNYRPGFEVRTTRLCQRVLMFHHFEDEPGVGLNCLVKSTEFLYRKPLPGQQNRVYTFLEGVEQSGYRRNPQEGSGYTKRSMPQVEFLYSEPAINDLVQELDPEALKNTPAGLAPKNTLWVDLYGEGIPGILYMQMGAWYYKRNITPINTKTESDGSIFERPMFDFLESVPLLPNLKKDELPNFSDITADGRTSIVRGEGQMGYYGSGGSENWIPYQPFEKAFKGGLTDPYLLFQDFTGDGLHDVVATRDSLWYRGLGIKGFDRPERIVTQGDNTENPMDNFRNDILGNVFFADFSGDGLVNAVSVNNGQVKYWPNFGYGKFGAPILMDNSPVFDESNNFDPRRIVLADIDGSGTMDMIYLHRDGARVYFNESGNSWSEPTILQSTKNLSSMLKILAVDLFGNGTTSLVISSSLPNDTSKPMYYIDLMGRMKPHLLLESSNNMGATTKITYSTSTKFYLQDKAAGSPWVTKLAVPVQVVESVTTYDYISRNKFTSRYAYHHGYFDGQEREFRGFGMVEEWDTEEISAVTRDDSEMKNWDAAHTLPPVHTKTWFHLGIAIGSEKVSRQYEHEYYQNPQYASWSLPDTVLPSGIDISEEYDAFRTLRGTRLRAEVYLDDAPPGSSDALIARAKIPLSIEEANFSLTRQQPRGTNIAAVFSLTQREIITFYFERDTGDPRIEHQMLLETNKYGQTLRQAAFTYGRQVADSTLPTDWDRDAQMKTWLSYNINTVTNAIDDSKKYPHSYRLPVNCEIKSYELTGISHDLGAPYSFSQFFDNNFSLLDTAVEIEYNAQPDLTKVQKRVLKLSRTLCRKDDLTDLLPLGQMEVNCISGQSFSFAFTPAMFNAAYQRNNTPLFASPDTMLLSKDGNGGGFMSTSQLKIAGLFPNADSYNGYWVPGNNGFYSMSNDPVQELAGARANFYRPVRTRDTFGAESSVTYDKYSLLIVGTLNPQGNVATIGERDSSGNLTKNGNDYRILDAVLITDPNGNRSAVICDALGSVVGSAVMGKASENFGDSLTNFVVDLDPNTILQHIADPMTDAKQVLQGATQRIMYDLFAYQRTKNTTSPQPIVAYSLIRMKQHAADITDPNQDFEIRHSYDYSDGFNRAIQAKTQTKPGPVVQRDANGHIIVNPNTGEPLMTDTPTDPRWISNGWKIYNNKGMVVANYEPFFTDRHSYELESKAGVSNIAFYDPLGRAVASLNVNNTFTKVKFSSWMSESWDANDTVLLDPRTDLDVSQYTAAYFDSNPGYQTWLQLRANKPLTDLDRQAAEKAKAHAGTPGVVHADSLGRTFLSISWNKVVCPGHQLDGTEWKQYQRVELDIEGHGIIVRDSNSDGGDNRGRIIENYTYDMLGRAMVKNSMDSGTRIWFMNALNQPLYQWDDRGYRRSSVYDKAGRLLYNAILGDTDFARGPDQEAIFNFNIFGEHHPNAIALNLLGKVYLSADQAGITVNTKHDFKGNLIDGSKRFNKDYKNTVDWSGLLSVIPLNMNPTTLFNENALNSALDTNLQNEEFSDAATYDASNRIIVVTLPNSDGSPSKTRMTYDQECITNIEGNIRAATDSGGSLKWIPYINDVDYDARGLRQFIDYGNGVNTTYTYDNIGTLLRTLSTRQNSSGSTAMLQDLKYTYDPNFAQTNITDTAQQTLYFRNQVVDPSNDYTYDALYQLIRATGREHLGQDGASPIPYGWDDSGRSGPQPGDEKAMGRYTEDYVYDHSGNMQSMQHGNSDPGSLGHSWTRQFNFLESSLLEPAKKNNRLSSTSVASMTENYTYDAHGNMTRMPHLGGGAGTQNMFWDFLDQTKMVDLGGGGIAYYVYDSSGNRIRKVIERNANLTQERIYLNDFLEIYRVTQNGTLQLERESVHIVDDADRIGLIETRTLDLNNTDKAPQQVQRYQLSNHLGSSTVEIDQDGKILSYEEYSPYGSTTYSAMDSSLELPKRYRFTGKERDDETGLEYHGMRYYCPWLARWTACDPVGGINPYEYCLSNPILYSDPTGGEESETIAERFRLWARGRAAEKIVYADHAARGNVIEKEVVIKGVKNRLGLFKTQSRLDVLGKTPAGEKFVEQIKWVGVTTEDGVPVINDALKKRIRSGFNNIAEEIGNVEEHARKSNLKAMGKKVGWVSERAEKFLGVGKGVDKSTLKFVVDGEQHVVDQFRNAAEAMHAELKAAGKIVPDAVEVLGGGPKPWKTITKAVAGKALNGVLGAVGIVSAGVALYTADNWTDRTLAALDLASGVMTFIPGLNAVGMGLGLALGVARAGIGIYNAIKENQEAANKPAPAEAPVAPVPPEAVPEVPPAETPPPPPEEPPAEEEASPAATPAAAPSPSNTGKTKGGTPHGGRHTLIKTFEPGNAKGTRTWDTTTGAMEAARRKHQAEYDAKHKPK
ncbi:hypothetical protein TWF694_004586 [Orbilia ellipsospora]|uniref:Uncharacterized protein n=1 Tax=Orbilia ellipsospora TaxID=2528407 RepID=A0AAV9WX03_9PEZI